MGFVFATVSGARIDGVTAKLGLRWCRVHFSVEGREAGVRKRLECLAAPDLSAYGARRAPYTIHVCLRALEPSSARTLQSLGDKAAPGVW